MRHPCRLTSIWWIVGAAAVAGSCAGEDSDRAATDQETGSQARPGAGTPGSQAELEIETLREIFGMPGEEDGGEWKVTVPQNDLDVRVDGFRIVPPMGLGSWATFTPAPEGAAVMGDLVVQEDEVRAVQATLLEEGLTITALHKHFLREEPRVAYMHFGGQGADAELGAAVKAVLDRIESIRGGDPAAASAAEVPNELDTESIARILGHDGAVNNGVFRVTIGRRDVSLQDRGAEVTKFGGFNTWAAFQGTPERAAVAGDFAMLPDEVDAVLRALVEHGIEVVVLHNHMVHEEPRILFLHYWGVGPAEDLATGLRAALDHTRN